MTDRIDGPHRKHATGPLKRLEHVVPAPRVEQVAVEIHIEGDKGGLEIDAKLSMRKTGRLPKLDARDVPDMPSAGLDALRRGTGQLQPPEEACEAEVPARTSWPQAMADAFEALASESNVNGLDPERQKKLNEVLARVQALIAKIMAIPSSGCREMLMGLVNLIMMAAAKGDLDLALTMCASTEGLTQKCAELCDHILSNIHKLRSGLHVAGPAGLLLKAIADAAEKAMNAASGPEALEAVADLTDRAVSIGEKLQDLKPGSKEYNELMAQLSMILTSLLMMLAAETPAAETPAAETPAAEMPAAEPPDPTQASPVA